MPILSARQSQVLMLIRREGPLTRQELHQRMNLRPNTVGEIVADMLCQGLLRESLPRDGGPGRPGRPLEIDPDRRRVVGVACEPGRVSACLLNLHGRRIGGIRQLATRSAREVVTGACRLIRALRTRQVLGIGISTTGFVDAPTRSILTSSATRRRAPTSLQPVFACAGSCPVLLENDMHAQAAYWLLSQNGRSDEDVLLVELRDGAIGAALLVNGQPNHGCIIGGNELGHMRFPVETDRCYCGQRGCLERICSSEFLRRLGAGAQADLYSCLMSAGPGDLPAGQIVRYLALGIANAVNLIRPNRVVLTGRLTECPTFGNQLVRAVRAQMLAPLVDRVRIDMWDRPRVSFAEAGAWLVLAAIYRGSPDLTGDRPSQADLPARQPGRCGGGQHMQRSGGRSGR